MKLSFKNKTSQSQFFLILLVWLLIFAMPLLFTDLDREFSWQRTYKIWIEDTLILGLFLINRFLLLPYLFFKRKRILYFSVVFALILTLSGTWFLTLRRQAQGRPPREMPPPNHDVGTRPVPPSPHNKPIPPYANMFIMSFLIIGFDTGLVFYSKWMRSEQNRLEVEKESVETKMAFLQNQISPHFFMNTLNNIHALVDIDTEEAKEAIIKLSQMMDYMLYESQTASIPLQREIDFIKSFVDLMKLRFTDEVDIVLDVPSTVPATAIPPLLTISFIENAFKYGVSYQARSYVHIHFDVNESYFNFNVINSRHPTQFRKKNSGIGIQNTRKRLKLIYNKDYKLDIKEEEKTFTVELTIPI